MSMTNNKSELNISDSFQEISKIIENKNLIK